MSALLSANSSTGFILDFYLTVRAIWQVPTMASNKKIVKEKGAQPDEFETSVAQV